MLKHPALAALAAAALALPLQALAYGDSWRWERHDDRRSQGPEKRLVEKYDRFAGSDKNARELVDGLRNDSQIELSKGGKTTTFKPATDQMGYGNVDLALGLAKASLAEHGIHKPTPEQIKAALNGGTVTTKSGQRVSLPGVLKLRASGMGWGQVAHKLGVKVGDVKGHGRAHRKDDDKHHHKHAKHDHRKHVKNDHKHKHDKHDWKHGKDHDRDHRDRHDHRKHAHHHKPDWKHDRHDSKQDHVKHHHQRPEFHRAKFERPERPHRPDKVERPERPERPDRPERPERHHHRR
jgi:hypothetical protein